MVSRILGFNSAITFLPGVVHVGLEIFEGVIGRFAFAPVGAGVGEHASAFKCEKYQMHGGGVGYGMSGSCFGGELLHIGDAGVQYFHTFVGVPVGAEAIAVVLQCFLGDKQGCSCRGGVGSVAVVTLGNIGVVGDVALKGTCHRRLLEFVA